MQLAQHRTADLSLLLQGKPSLSMEDIVDCFDWTEPRGSRAVTFLRELLGDASARAGMGTHPAGCPRRARATMR